MKIRTTLTVSAAAVLTTLALAGCSAGAGSSTASSAPSSGSMSGMDMGSSTPSASSSAANNAADVMFAQMMIAHHMQAVEMADIVLKKTGVNPKVTALAEKIKAAQSPEIDQMNGFLTSWGEKTVTSSSGMTMSGSNMMSSADMDALQKASGAKASSLFLTQMTQHHTSAVAMAKDEVKNGQDPQAVALAKKIVADQTAEIATMKQLLTQI